MLNESAQARRTFAAVLRVAMVVVLALGGAVGTATALTPDDAYQVGYAANLAAGDSFVDLTNAGTAGVNICANVYVLAADEQLIACCTCPLTPNALESISVRKDLVSNPLTPGTPDAVSIVVTASTNNPCNAAQPATYTSGLRVWGTTIHQAPDGSYQDTETPFQTAPVNAREVARLTSTCGFIQANGSFYGICKTCSPGARGGQKQ